MNSRHFKELTLLFGLFFLDFTSGCKAETFQVVIPVVTQIPTSTSSFAKGGDISWLAQMEATGFKFFSDNGVNEDCFKILKDHNINTIRLRTFVNPSNDKTSGHCSKYETVAMAARAKSWGMRIMIDFHYSDTWADPSQQVKPAAWASHSFPKLLTDVYNYTHGVMAALDSAGVTPEWVQIGNEIPSGMLLPDGSTSNWPQLSQLINKGYDAVKAVSPSSKVVLHIDQGNNNARFRWWFDAAKANGAKYDVIGMSYYPYWLTGKPDYKLSINDLGNNLLDMVSRYGKQVMVVEVGGEDTNAQNTKDMLTAVINKVRAVPNNAGLGVIYWEPEGARSWSGYALSAWGSETNPQPTIALDAFLTPTSATSKISSGKLRFKVNHQNGTLDFNEKLASIELINMKGSILFSANNSDTITVCNLPKGSYLVRTKSHTFSHTTIFKYNI